MSTLINLYRRACDYLSRSLPGELRCATPLLPLRAQGAGRWSLDHMMHIESPLADLLVSPGAA